METTCPHSSVLFSRTKSLRVKHQLTSTHSLGTNLSLTTLEITIVSTSLVAITNDLHGFSQSSWVITAYLLTYFGQKPSSASGS